MNTSYGIKEYDTKYIFNFTSLHEIGNLTSAYLKQKCTRIFSEVKLFLILSLFIPALRAEIIETSDITQITSHISQGTLVLLDIDNTIIQLTMNNILRQLILVLNNIWHGILVRGSVTIIIIKLFLIIAGFICKKSVQ
jgi:hypothetical protein